MFSLQKAGTPGLYQLCSIDREFPWRGSSLEPHFLHTHTYPSYNQYQEQVATLNKFIPIFRAAQHEVFLGNSRQWPPCLHCTWNLSKCFCSIPSHGIKLLLVRDVCSRVSTCRTDFQLAATPFIINHTLEVCTHISILLNGWLQWPHIFKTLHHKSL